MGFAGVSGLPMGTRSGDVPIDVLFYLLRGKKFDDKSLDTQGLVADAKKLRSYCFRNPETLVTRLPW